MSDITPSKTSVQPPSARSVGQDVPRVADSRPYGVVLDDVIDDIVTREPADEQDEQAGHCEADRDHPQRRAPPAAREPQGDCEKRQRHEPEEPCEVVQELRQILRGLELVGLKYLDAARVGG